MKTIDDVIAEMPAEQRKAVKARARQLGRELILIDAEHDVDAVRKGLKAKTKRYYDRVVLHIGVQHQNDDGAESDFSIDLDTKTGARVMACVKDIIDDELKLLRSKT